MTRIELERVLTLNRVWQPLTTLVLRKALVLVARGRARIVCPQTFQIFNWKQWIADRAVAADAHVIEADYIRTATMHVRIPQVITLAKFAGYPNAGVPFSRRGVYERDNGRCQYCNAVVHKRDMTLDHVVPVSRGGATSWGNCVLACGRCNHRKADRTPREAEMSLVETPQQPTREDLLLRGVHRNPAWEPFIGKAAEVTSASTLKS
ncbi:MAG: HNH endonuclease [Planctomycetes bacterium]|nr:HNH endonuclease [Planctomycetota bacterium]MCW8136717.1 HNH endonuclease [Planctomycetota bacterium]